MTHNEKVQKLKAAESSLAKTSQLAIVRAAPEFQGIVVALLDVVKVLRAVVEEQSPKEFLGGTAP